MTLKLRATHLAPPAYAHLKEYVVLSGSCWLDQRGTCGQGLVLGVGTPFDPDKVKMHGSHVDKRQFQAAWDKWWSGPTLGFWLIGRACMYVLAGR